MLLGSIWESATSLCLEYTIYSNVWFNLDLEHVFQSSRHCSNYYVLVLIKILPDEYKLKKYSLLVLLKMTFSEKHTLKSIAQNFQTCSAEMISHWSNNWLHQYLQQVFWNPTYCSNYSLMTLIKVALLKAPCWKLKAFKGFLKVFIHFQIKWFISYT